VPDVLEDNDVYAADNHGGGDDVAVAALMRLLISA